MAKLNEEKPDDLEIASIGALYRGHWDKKYWSSSRGKDRYPYPVGYQAIRTHSGITYRMEIREGLNGPIFAVISPDGDSCTGQTPDIAWENLQKKTCPRVKNWLGKRFSSKIDGVELFGFRNPFVQRLLRELVANINGVAEMSSVVKINEVAERSSVVNINGVAERSSVIPTMSSKASITDHERVEDSHAYPDLLPVFGKQRITGKRSMKNRSSAENLIKEAGIKRTCSQVLLNNAKCNSSYQEGWVRSFSTDKNMVCFQEQHMPSSKDVTTIQVTSSHLSNSLGDGNAVVNSEALHHEFQNDGKILGSTSSRKICDMTMEPDSPSETKTASIAWENCHSLLVVDEEPDPKHAEFLVEKNAISNELGKSCNAGPELKDPLSSSKNSDGKDVGLGTHPNVSIPGTCDTRKDDVFGYLSEGYTTSLCSTKNEFPVAVAVPVLETSISSVPKFLSRSLPEEVPAAGTVDSFSRNIIKDSLPEIGSSSGSSNPSSEKIDLDLAGQELARSMMTFLLPRAVPLLRKTYAKKRSRHRNRENKTGPCSPSFAPSVAEEVERKHPIDKVCQDDNIAKALVQGLEVNTEEKKNSPPVLLATDPPCQITMAELSSGCMTTEPFTESDVAKDVKSVIPDSFEDDHCASDVAIKRKFSSSLDEIAIAFLNGKEGNINPPILPENNLEKPSFCLETDGYAGEILLPKGNEQAVKDASVKNQVDAQIAHTGHDQAESTVKGEIPPLCEPSVLSSGVVMSDGHKIGMLSNSSLSSGKRIVPISESIICRNYENCNHPEMCFPQKTAAIDQASDTGGETDSRLSARNTVKTDGELHQLITGENIPASVHVLSSAAPADHQIVDVAGITEEAKPVHLIDPSVSNVLNHVNNVSDLCLHGEGCRQSKQQSRSLHVSGIEPPLQKTIDLDCKGHSDAQVAQRSCLDDVSSKRESITLDTRDSMELAGCYLHPDPVLSISLTSKEDGLQLSVLCGTADKETRSLFMYMIPLQGYGVNCPSFLGYTSLMFPLKNPCYRDIPVERFGLQFTPDKRSLVFLNYIKAPHCRERNFDCLCTDCTSKHAEDNTVEIAHVNFGYVSSVIKLATTESVSSILSFEPNHLIAVGRSGKLHVWVMNLEWSVKVEEFLLPEFDDILPIILELKRIPNYRSLVIGHNGVGGFALWDISQRVRLAKFSSPDITTFQILPVGLCKWCSDSTLTTSMEIVDSKETTLMTAGEDALVSSLEKDLAVWLLVSAYSGEDGQCQMSVPEKVLTGCWRLGLLVKNAVILGSIIDPRASAACTSSHHGIYGTSDGFLYKWELSTGKQITVLHPFKCGSVSDIATDVKSGAVAVGGDRGQLLVYAQSRICQ